MHPQAHPSEQEALGEESGLVLQDQGPPQGSKDGVPGPHPPPAALAPLLKPENPHSAGGCVGPPCPAELESAEQC